MVFGRYRIRTGPLHASGHSATLHQEQRDMEDIINIPSNPQSDGPRRALTIVAETPLLTTSGNVKTGDWKTTTWKFYGTDYGTPVGCRTDSVRKENTAQDSTQQLYPFGMYDFELFGEACQYRNNGHTSGRLTCADKIIQCTRDAGSANPPSTNAAENGNYLCDDNFLRQSMFTCPY